MYELKSKKGKAALFVFIGLGAGIFCFMTYSDAAESEEWPSVKGEIIKSGAKHVNKMTTDKSKWKWEPEVAYRYEVAGNVFENNRIRMGIGSLSYDSHHLATRSISDYPEGGKVLVYYDPHYPQSSTLEKGVSIYVYLGFVISLVAIVAGVLFLL